MVNARGQLLLWFFCRIAYPRLPWKTQTGDHCHWHPDCFVARRLCIDSVGSFFGRKGSQIVKKHWFNKQTCTKLSDREGKTRCHGLSPGE
ncbi:hypothetical protein BJV82DRAFT_254617 [Fennellomyces sp. T-0311]|nr:hypothetical protein BJV82DRAFT_254617 [Fennellomyces sp. T-0311]